MTDSPVTPEMEKPMTIYDRAEKWFSENFDAIDGLDAETKAAQFAQSELLRVVQGMEARSQHFDALNKNSDFQNSSQLIFGGKAVVLAELAAELRRSYGLGEKS